MTSPASPAEEVMSKASKRLSGLNEAAIVDHETRQEDKRFTVWLLYCYRQTSLVIARRNPFPVVAAVVVVVVVVVNNHYSGVFFIKSESSLS